MTDTADAAARSTTTDESPPAKVGRMANTISIIALIVSVISLLVTGYVSFGQLRVQKESLNVQEGQIRALKQQFHGVVAIQTTKVNLLNQETNTWIDAGIEDRSFDRLLKYDEFGSSVYVMIWVANVGETPAAIQQAGILVGDGQIKGRSINCAREGGETIIPPCVFPKEIPSQSVLQVHVRINDITDLLTCNPYVDEFGLVAAVRLLDGSVVSMPTTTSVPFSNDCEQGVAPPS